MTRAPTVLGVDLSTQATKIEVRDLRTGRLTGRGRAPHPTTTPPRSEQDPRDWWRALVVAARAVDGASVAAVSVAGQQHGLVALDEGGEVVRPAMLWNDTESAPDAAALVERLVPLSTSPSAPACRPPRRSPESPSPR